MMVTTTVETRVRWEPTEPVPEGWQRGNQVFVGDFLEVFVYDPAVPYAEREQGGGTDRWIKFRRVDERRYVTTWEPSQPEPSADKRLHEGQSLPTAATGSEVPDD